MPNVRTMFTCQKCDAQSTKWMGRCLECGAWGSLTEGQKPNVKKGTAGLATPGKTVGLADINPTSYKLQATTLNEVDRVLGGGIVPGGVYLLAGEPGIGKSTLVAQIAESCAENILYVTGEESPEQLKQRFVRTGISNPRLAVLAETAAETIAATIETEKPALAIIDSIQTIQSEAAGGAGAPTQLKSALAILIETAKRTSTAVLLIGHVTKSSDIAGPKLLEHLVDVVLTFEGERSGGYRVLRAQKNRFGSTSEVGIFEMVATGLKEVPNPSAAFLASRSKNPGSIITCILEGVRPILLEIQALAVPSRYPYPERRATGYDPNRLNLLLAVLAKHCPTLKVGQMDIHVNVTSGFRIREPAADLAVLLAIASSIKNRPIPQETCAIAEVGLGGELRGVREINRRIREANTFGCTTVLVPAGTTETLPQGAHPLSHIGDALTFLNLA